MRRRVRLSVASRLPDSMLPLRFSKHRHRYRVRQRKAALARLATFRAHKSPSCIGLRGHQEIRPRSQGRSHSGFVMYAGPEIESRPSRGVIVGAPSSSIAQGLRPSVRNSHVPRAKSTPTPRVVFRVHPARPRDSTPPATVFFNERCQRRRSIPLAARVGQRYNRRSHNKVRGAKSHAYPVDELPTLWQASLGICSE